MQHLTARAWQSATRAPFVRLPDASPKRFEVSLEE
jgi:hypothetical protein